MAHGAGTSSDEDYFAVQGSRPKPPWAVLGDGQSPVSGDRGNAQACADVKPGVLRQRKDPLDRQDGELLRCPAIGALVGGQGQPDPVTGVEVLDAGSDGVHHSGAVLVRYDLREGQGLARFGAAARLPVGGVHPGDDDPHAHLPAPRVADLAVNEFENRRIAGGTVHDCFHTQT